LSFKLVTWLPTSFIDWEGNITAVLFASGCNFRCPFCHNHEIVFYEGEGIPLIEVLDHLENRKGWLDGVVITGGEPTIHKDLPKVLKEIKARGWKIKLDTNGSNPDMLKLLIDEDLVDFIAMDIKTSPSKYQMATRVKVDTASILKSIDLLLKLNVKVEFRTTVVPSIVDADDVKEIRKIIGESARYVLQSFIPQNSYDPSFRFFKPYEACDVVNWDKKAILRGF